MTLYLISGHGAGDPGAGGNGFNEADVVRQISSRLKALGGSQVVELDKSIDWYKAGRVNRDLKNQVGNDPVLEIHLDSGGSDARGGHVIIKEGSKADTYDVNLANFLKSFFPGRASVIVARSNLANVNRAAANDINYRLMECCFITNSADMQKLISQMDEFCRGVLSAFGIGSNQEEELINVAIPSGTYEVYRAYNTRTGAHFYTSNEAEYEGLGRDWNKEGVGWKGADTGAIVYRLKNPNDGTYMFTVSHDEADTLVKAGWKAEGVNFASARQGKPVYRLYNPNTGDHFFTVSADERDSLVKVGWKSEGTAFYAV